MISVDYSEKFASTVSPTAPPLNHPEHLLVITPFKRLIATVAFILPVVALAASPAVAATKAKPHHVAAVHKTVAHKTTTHTKKIVKPSAS
jgi:hypothetical protein